jgi:hypothetical protein
VEASLRLRLGEFPGAVEDFFSRRIETHCVIPTRHDRQAVGNLAVATAELHGNRTVAAFLRRDVVQGIGVVRIGFQVTLRVVNRDRPERIHRDCSDIELVNSRAIVLGRRHTDISRVFFRIATPPSSSADQVIDRIDLLLAAEGMFEQKVILPVGRSSPNRLSC